jgi:2-polyprenyl-3-methyl-5-hydroxy-6-metoxy-1,4-benzoquinol methylase
MMLTGLKRRFRHWIFPFSELEKCLGEEASVFDVGMGSGLLLERLGRRNPGRRLGGLEVRRALVEAGQAHLKEAGLRQVEDLVWWQTGEALPEVMRAYDWICVMDVWHHLPEEEQAHFLDDLFAAIRPGARVLFKDIDAAKIWGCQMNRWHDRLLSGDGGGEITAEEARDRLRESGFEVETGGGCWKGWYPHYWWVARKR